jgi:hypothetical protein
VRADRRFIIAGVVGVVLIVAGGASDFFTGTFWERHALLASLAANLVVVAVTVVVLNEVLERRDRKRWNLLAQHALFALVQGARATWTGFVEILRLAEVQSGSVQHILDAALVAREPERVSAAARELLEDPERRATLQRVVGALSDHVSSVIARWAPVLVSARPYAEALDRHVELAARLEWLSSVLAHNEPVEGRSYRDAALTRSSVGAERAEELGGDDQLHDMILAVVRLATELDYESREHALSLTPDYWWSERTAGLAGQAPADRRRA